MGADGGLGSQAGGTWLLYDAIPSTGRTGTSRLAGWFRLETFELTRHHTPAVLWRQRPREQNPGVASLMIARIVVKR